MSLGPETSSSRVSHPTNPAAWVLFGVQILGLLASLALAIGWERIWGDLDLWIAPVMATIHVALAIASIFVFWRLRVARVLPPLIAIGIGLAANLVLIAIAWNDLPDTAFG